MRFAMSKKLGVRYFTVYEGPQLEKVTRNLGIGRKMIEVLEKLFKFLTADGISLTGTDFIIVLEKR
jgi:hypothetical protein